MGWALVIVTLVWVEANALVIIPRHPELLAERMGPRKGAKTWDTVLISFVGLAALVRLVVAGLDLRFGWTTGIPFPHCRLDFLSGFVEIQYFRRLPRFC